MPPDSWQHLVFDMVARPADCRPQSRPQPRGSFIDWQSGCIPQQWRWQAVRGAAGHFRRPSDWCNPFEHGVLPLWACVYMPASLATAT